VRPDRDDDPDALVSNRTLGASVSCPQRPVERRVGVVVINGLDDTTNFKRAVFVVRVGDRQGNADLVLEIGEFMPVLGVGHAQPRAVPRKPHHAALRRSVRAYRRQVREEGPFEQIGMTGWRCRQRVHREPFRIR